MLSQEMLSQLHPKEREIAIKRARNREAARRSRQRKNERINQLYKEIRSLQQENLVLLKSIENFTEKALSCMSQQAALKQELHILSSSRDNPLEHQSFIGYSHTCDENNNSMMEDFMDLEIPIVNDQDAQTLSPPDSCAPSFLSLDHGKSRSSPVKSLALPSFEELQKLQEAAEPAQLTARGSQTVDKNGSLSARAAVAEHIAMLSRDNSPRDDENGTVAAAGHDHTGGKSTTTGATKSVVEMSCGEPMEQQQTRHVGLACILSPETNEKQSNGILLQQPKKN